ncbi:MAG: tRNA-specific adenosine deaminase, partial [Lactobacillus helsingborgensis]|nr:tRNA-specific adenosine deaminase [Lactobacillus helsingborgensis]
NHHPNVVRGLYREEASQMLKSFFKEIRQKQKAAKDTSKNFAN